MHAFYASWRRYNHGQRVFFRLLRRFQPVFWTSACCSFNWVSAGTKAYKSNFITLSFGTSTQTGNIYRQLSEKWSSAIWHKQSNSLCHGSKAAPVLRAHHIWAGIQETSRGSWLSVVLLKQQAWKKALVSNIKAVFSKVTWTSVLKHLLKTGQRYICHSSQRQPQLYFFF